MKDEKAGYARLAPGFPASTPARVERLYSLWDRLSDYSSKANNEALRHCMSQLCAWTGAHNAFWIGAVRLAKGNVANTDSHSGWRIGAVEMLKHVHTTPRRIDASARAINSGDPDGTTRAVLARTGQFRVHTLRGGLVDLRAFRKTDQYEYFYRQPGICDRMWVVFPINADVESYFCFDKYGDRGRFGTRAVATAAEALRGIKWFHRRLLLNHGLGVCEESMTRAEHRVLRELLSGAPEKAIAERLDLTVATTHQYVVRIFRKFGVRGRAELMSLWINSNL